MTSTTMPVELVAEPVLEEAEDAPLDEGLFGVAGVPLPLGGRGRDRLELGGAPRPPGRGRP